MSSRSPSIKSTRTAQSKGSALPPLPPKTCDFTPHQISTATSRQATPKIASSAKSSTQSINTGTAPLTPQPQPTPKHPTGAVMTRPSSLRNVSSQDDDQTVRSKYAPPPPPQLTPSIPKSALTTAGKLQNKSVAALAATADPPPLCPRMPSDKAIVSSSSRPTTPAISNPKLGFNVSLHQRTASASSDLTALSVATATPLSYDQQSIKVVVRVRDANSSAKQQPPSSRPSTPDLQRQQDPQTCLTLSGNRKLDISDPKTTNAPKTFHFDTVFGPDVSQESVYSTAVDPLIRKCLEGYNGCIFAYGQTASGKTHTMQGPASRISESLSNDCDSLHPDIGIISRVVHQLDDHVKANRGRFDDASGKCFDFVIKVSYLEIYNEGLVDLLVDDDKQDILKIRIEHDSATGRDLYVQNLSEKYISSLQDYLKILTTGAKNRSVGETNMNAQSSRSHAILTITIDQYLVEPKQRPGLEHQESEISLLMESLETTMHKHSPQILQKIGQGRKRSKIHLIDLAGSERVDSTGATGDRLKEGAQINQSLSALGNVISALTSPTTGGSKQQQHVPYRDSKLTYLLSDSLGGNALTLMITCCSPMSKNYNESLSTLRFAERVKKVVNKAVVNMDPYLLRIAGLEAEILRLRTELEKCTCGRNGGGKCEKHVLSSSSSQHQQTELDHGGGESKQKWWVALVDRVRGSSGCCSVGSSKRVGVETVNAYTYERVIE
ncbi:UNVERIFIED_CONTAM: Kinesin-like protein kif21b [Siphonaria sp. JEL0065]|nr:Kinesin-like protein kif21b [Siphonaria sp. JEL0065]